MSLAVVPAEARPHPYSQEDNDHSSGPEWASASFHKSRATSDDESESRHATRTRHASRARHNDDDSDSSDRRSTSRRSRSRSNNDGGSYDVGSHSVGPRPSQWCGWYMRTRHGGGPEYNLAANWRHWGSPGSPQIGAIVVWPHHVGEIVGQSSNGQWIVLSGNWSGRVHSGPRSITGATIRV